MVKPRTFKNYRRHSAIPMSRVVFGSRVGSSTGGATSRGRSLRPKLAAKRPRPSYVQTKTKTEQRLKVQGAGGIVTKFKHSNPVPLDQKILNKICPPNVWQRDDSQRVTVTQGLQAAFAFSYASASDLAALDATITTANASVARTTTIVLNEVKGEYLIGNASRAAMEVDIYDIVTKRDIPDDIKDVSGNLIGDSNPVQLWGFGTADEAGQGSPIGTSSGMPGILPTDSMLFNRYYKVLKHTALIMSEGATHRHMINIRHNKRVRNYASLLSSYCGNLTYWTMVVVKGQPVANNANTSQITLASGALNVVRDLRYKYRWVSDVTENLFVHHNLPSFAPANEYLMDPADGLAETNATA